MNIYKCLEGVYKYFLAKQKGSLLSTKCLAVHIPQVAASRDTSMNPALRRHLLHQVTGVLNVLLENGDQGIILLGEEGLRNSTAFLAHADLFGMDQQGLHILVTTTPRHVGDRQEGAGLGPGLTPVRLEAGLVADVGVCVNGRIVVSKALSRIN